MSEPDIAIRLRSRTKFSPDASPASDLMDEAADEIERLRAELKECQKTLHRLAMDSFAEDG